MSEPKTKPTGASVQEFLKQVDDEARRQDCFALLEIMKNVTGEEPKMWGPSMIGFGTYTYRYASGRDGDWFVTGFSPRKRDLTIYMVAGFTRFEDLMSRLGSYKTGKSCLYVKRLSDIDLAVLTELIETTVAVMRKKYGSTD